MEENEDSDEDVIFNELAELSESFQEMEISYQEMEISSLHINETFNLSDFVSNPEENTQADYPSMLDTVLQNVVMDKQ